MRETIQPLITLSIVSHGDENRIDRLLDSLRRYEQTDQLEVILTDNLGFDLPEVDPEPWAALKILRNKRPAGFAHNQNRAFRSAQGKYFCVLNPDVVFEEPVLVPLLNCLESGDADLIAPLVVNSNGELQDSFRSLPTPSELFLRRLPLSRVVSVCDAGPQLLRPDWIAGMFMLMPTRVFCELNGFDEAYYLYFEDVDFCTRAKLAGLRPAVHARHQVGHDGQRASRKRISYGLMHLQSAMRFFKSDVYKRARERKAQGN